MGIVKENEILSQAKKGQGETNQRLDELLANSAALTNCWPTSCRRSALGGSEAPG